MKNKITISRRRGTDVTPEESAAITAGCNAVLSLLCPEDVCALSVTVCREEEIRRINREERDTDAVTDVLSFPMLSLAPGDKPGEIAGDADREEGRIYLGDMVICAERAREQARNFGHSVRREFAFLAAHSVLHFLGYDHMEDGERKEMERLQKAALDAAGYTRDIK